MNKIIDGKVAVVSGVVGEIGRAVAFDLAANGARLVLIDTGVSPRGGRGESAVLDDVVRQVRDSGGEAVGLVKDVSNWDGAREVVATALNKFGRIDIVVTNAGVQLNAASHSFSAAEFRDLLQFHLFGSYYLCRAAAASFITQRAGAYVHMTSTAGLIGSSGKVAYASAASAITGLSRGISFDLKSHGVRSNCVAPSAFDDVVESISSLSPKDHANEAEMHSTAMLPDQVAPLVTFLASDAAAGVTGQIFGVRANELYLYSQPRPVRTLERAGGWTPSSVADELLPAWSHSFTPPERTADVFPWPAL